MKTFVYHGVEIKQSKRGSYFFFLYGKLFCSQTLADATEWIKCERH